MEVKIRTERKIDRPGVLSSISVLARGRPSFDYSNSITLPMSNGLYEFLKVVHV